MMTECAGSVDAVPDATEREKSFILNSVSDGLVYLDRSLHIQWANRRALDLFNTTIETLRGKTCNQLWGDGLHCPSCPVDTAVTTRRPASIERTLVSGSVIVITSAPLFDDHNEIIGAVQSIRDITEQRNAEREAQLHREELAHRTRVSTMGQMLAALTHEVNQPLTAILCNAKAAVRFMQQGKPDMQEIAEILADIADSAGRANMVIEGLRTFLRKGETCRGPLAINKLIRDTVGLLNAELDARAVTVQLDLLPAVPTVLSDFVQVQQVLVNLLMNACDAVSDLSGRKRVIGIATKLSLDGRKVLTSVGDSGAGISSDMLSRLFEPFASGKKKGMGIGLALCRSIITANEGEIYGANRAGGGAVFTFSLPVCSPATGSPDMV